MAKKLSISHDEIMQIIKPKRDQAVSWAESLSDERKECLDLYNCAPLGTEVDGFSQIVSSTVFEAIEWTKPYLAGVFTHPEFFVVKAEAGDQGSAGQPEQDWGERVGKILRYQLFTQQDGAKQIRDFNDTALKYHYGIFKICYEQDFDDVEENYERLTIEQAEQLKADGVIFTKYDEVTGVDEATGQPSMWLENVKTIRREIKFQGPRVQAVPPWEFFISPGVASIDAAPFVAHRPTKTMHDIRSGENSGLYEKGSFAKLSERVLSATDNDVSFVMDEEIRQHGDGGRSADLDLSTEDAASTHKADIVNREVNLWEIYTKIDIDNDGLAEPVIISIVDDVILRVEENPYKRPVFRIGKLIEVPFRLEGRPLPKILEQDQKELTNMTRIFTDAVADATYATPVSNDPLFLKDWANRFPGAAIRAQDPNRIVFERPAPPPQQVINAIEMKEGNVERKSGVSRYSQGVDAESLNKTATGISIISQNGQTLAKFRAQVLGETIKDMLEDMIAINKMWPPYIEAEDLRPEEGLFNRKFHIDIEVGVGPQDRAEQAQALERHQQWLVQFAIPQGAATIEDSIKTESKIGKLVGVPFDNLMLPPGEAMARADQAQQMQAQMQQMQQQMEQMGQQMQQMDRAAQGAMQQAQKLSQENQMLKSQPPEDKSLEVAKLQAQAEQGAAELTLKAEIERGKVLIEQEKVDLDRMRLELEAKKMVLDARVKASAQSQMKEGNALESPEN